MKQEAPPSKESPDLPVGAFWRRVAAFLYDLLFVLVLSLISASLSGWLFLERFAETVQFTSPAALKGAVRTEVLSFLSKIALFLFLYFVLLEYLWRQGTLGKIIFSLRILTDTGQRPTLRQVVVRSLTKFTIGPLTLGLSWLAALLSKRRQAWHDRIAKTCVRYVPNAEMLLSNEKDAGSD